jgi:sugar phosphate isomerase/epimerase
VFDKNPDGFMISERPNTLECRWPLRKAKDRHGARTTINATPVQLSEAFLPCSALPAFPTAGLALFGLLEPHGCWDPRLFWTAAVLETKRLGAIAEKHRMMVGYHGHTDITNPEHFGGPASWETAMSYSPYNGINLDLGHFVAANNTSPIPFLTKYHDRVTHIHVKDRKMNGGPAVPSGEGDVPLHDVFRLMAKVKWPFQATIEFEYPIPEGSNRMAEIAKCVGFCKACLL